ncbi:MAG: pyrroline-5-carboxylate reductase [Lautropia sp.]|nr:pyrroline-5-carboxylate reductase [Lautropia sp.]
MTDTAKATPIRALFLGYGRMGSALGEAWLKAGLVDRIDAVDPNLTAPVQARVFRSTAELPAAPHELIVLAVKPAMAREALRSLPPGRFENATVLSVMAGVPISTLETALPSARPVVRSMPNTPVMVGQGCTGLYGNRLVTPVLQKTIGRLFGAVGKAFWLTEEEQLHAVTALSGSGPAYYHLFSEALAEAGVKLGLPRQMAIEMAAQTALGAATLQNQAGADFVALRQAVTSPNGTTHAAIVRFEEQGALRTLVEEAATRACRRSEELGGS